jgi:predicted membrane channel-forming protein YqfA (hemolysin III family)
MAVIKYLTNFNTMENNKKTFKEDFINNYLSTSLILSIMFIVILAFTVLRNDPQWFLSFCFLAIAWVIIPIAAIISYKRKSK